MDPATARRIARRARLRRRHRSCTILRLPLIFVLGLLACNDAASVITFVHPKTVIIRPGDTVETLARNYSVPIDHLMEWNGIREGDPLVVGRKIVVFEFPEDTSLASLAAEDGTIDQPATAAANPRPKARARRPTNTPILKVEPTVVVADVVQRPRPGEGVKVELPAGGRVGQAGVLGGIDGLDMGSTDGLADAAANMEGRRGGNKGLGLRNNSSLGGGGTAENMDHVADTRVLGKQATGPGGSMQGIRVPRLPKPPAKRCLAGPSEKELSGDDSYVMSKGLTADQVRSGMSRIVRQTLSCIPTGVRGEFTVTVEVTAGCDGTVTDVWLANSGGMPAQVTSCITQTIYFASFPAHALPDGALFQYPITYRF